MKTGGDFSRWQSIALLLSVCLLSSGALGLSHLRDVDYEKAFNVKANEGASNSAWTNICTNGKDASKLNLKDYMTEFAKGPCSPVILLPGIMGSVLQVQINCAQLKASDPTTFKECGWSTCPGEENYSITSSPSAEYQVWVPGVTSPMTIITPTESSKLCFGNLVQVNVDTSSGTLKPVNKPGVTFSVKGFTPQTQGYKASECGTTAIENLIDGLIDPEMTQYYKDFIIRLKDMGYKSGLTLQALPYDFRLPSGYDLASKGLPNMIKKLKDLNNKKVIVASHSMGNSKTLYALWNMSQQDKDNNIALYFAIAPPFIGAAKPVDYLTCGSSEFFHVDFGIDMRTWKLSAGSFLSIFELAPWTTYTTQASQPWMQKIKARIAYEQGQSSDPVFNFLPTKDKICFSKFTNKNCASGLEDFEQYGSYLGNPLTNANYRSWMNQHSFDTHAAQTWPILDQRFETQPNPGVPTVVLYSQVLATEGKYNYKIDPLVASNANRFCTDKEAPWTPWKGDTTVPSTSAVTPALKWAYEFQTQLPNAKPIKLVDICSEYNVKPSPYDGTDSSGRNILNNVGYIGMICDCTQSADRHCDHESMLFLPQMLDFFAKTLMTNDKETVSQTVQNMTEQQLENYQQTCQVLMSVTGNSEESSVKTETS